MKKGGLFSKEIRAVVLAAIALIAVLIAVLAVSGRKLAESGAVSDGAGGVLSAAEHQRRRAEETFVYAKYGALWRYDGNKTAQLAKLPHADESEDMAPSLAEWAALTADERTVYFIDIDENYDGKLYRQRVAQDAEPEKITSHLVSYAVFGSDLFYLRESGALYKNGERLAQNIDSLQAIADDGSRLLAIDDESRLFLIAADDPENRQRIDREIVLAGELDEGLNEIFYITQDDELLIWSAEDGRRTLGTIAWEFCEEDPDRDQLFYWEAPGDDEEDDPALCYYDAAGGKGLRLFGYDGDEMLQAIGVFPKERLLWAVFSNDAGELTLARRSLSDGGGWRAVEEDLENVPPEIVCGSDGAFYYLQGLGDDWEAFDWDAFDEDDIDWSEWDWDFWDALLDQTVDRVPEGVLHVDGKELAVTANSVFGGGDAVYLLDDVDMGAETFGVSVLEGTGSRRIADDVYIYRLLSDGTLVTLRDFSERRREGDLYLTKDGRDRLLDHDVMWFSDAAYY